MICALGRCVGEIGYVVGADVAVVDHSEAQAFEHGDQAGCAKRRWAHQRPALRRAHVDRGAQERYSSGRVWFDGIGHNNSLFKPSRSNVAANR
jgi:hypothetical protein